MKYANPAQHADHRVAVIACHDYAEALPSLEAGVALLGGLDQFCQPGESLLLKPNLLLGDSPERGSTTHPEFFKAVINLFKNGGRRLVYGDSPGFGSPYAAARASGLDPIATASGVDLANFVDSTEVANPDGMLLKQFNLANGVLDVDGVINLPKFKTHALTRLTGAVKNLFGCLPGVQKASFHAQLPDELRFGEMLVDLAGLIAPRLNIMDGVLGMEGNGPRNGHLRAVGLILISANSHALDHCVARIMDLDPGLVPTLKAAQENGYYDPSRVEVFGETLEVCVLRDYEVNRSPASTTGPKKFYMGVFKNWISPKPAILPEKCSHCGRCVGVCPVTPKAIGFHNGRKRPPQYDYQQCIRCYCCQEMCPDEAIFIHTPPVGKLLNKFKI